MSTEKRKRFFQHPRLNVSHELHHGSQGGCILGQKCANMKTKTLFFFRLILCTRKANFREHILPILNFRLNLENKYDIFALIEPK